MSLFNAKLTFAAAIAAMMLVPARAEAFELKHTTSGLTVRWADPTVTFVIDPSVESAAAGASGAVESALASWSGAEGAPGLSFTMGPGGGKVAVDGVNTVLYAPDGYGPAGDALAITILSFDQSTGEIVDADIVINGQHAFEVLAADARAAAGTMVALDGAGAGEGGGADGPFDIEHVVSHEFGHALGLGDVESDSVQAVMFAYSAPGDASNRVPAADDLAGLDAIYGTTAHGCAASIAGQRGCAGWAWSAAAVVVALGIAARRRRGVE